MGRDALQSQLSEEDLTRPPMPVTPIAGGSVELELSQAQTALADARSRYMTTCWAASAGWTAAAI